MTLSIELKRPERLLLHTDTVAIGTFRCSASDSMFADSGPCNSHVIVFPRSAVEITHEGGESFVGDPTTIALYNYGQQYRRRAIAPVDHSDWIALSGVLLRDLGLGGDPRPFRRAYVKGAASLYLRQRRLFASLSEGHGLDGEAEEEALTVVAEALTPALELREADSRSATMKVAVVKRLIASQLSDNVPLQELAAAATSSPFRLCRLFKAATGMTLTEYRTDLRLRSSLQLLERRDSDILEVALRLGFTSHSHFTSRFTRRFGVTPSAFRASVGPRRCFTSAR